MIPDRDLVPWTAPTCTVYRAGHLYWCACQGASNLDCAVGLQAGCTALLACPAYLKRQKTSTTPSYRLSDALQLHRSVRYSCIPRLSLLPHRRRRPPQTLLCVILSWNLSAWYTARWLAHSIHPPPQSSHSRAAQIHLVDEIRLTKHMLLTYSLKHSLTTHARSHPRRTDHYFSPHGPAPAKLCDTSLSSTTAWLTRPAETPNVRDPHS